jgi:hypothetical protein
MWLLNTMSPRFNTVSSYDAPFELVDQQRGSFSAASFVSNRILNFNFIQNRPIIQLNQEGVADGTLGRLVVFHTEAFLLYTVDLGTEGINTWVSGRSICAETITVQLLCCG